ncbi:MAG TPA: PKD domain-containing protein [Holophagaceae bacterium]|nr:PKD domain-containing protein [Holophagaceae bacterium]
MPRIRFQHLLAGLAFPLAVLGGTPGQLTIHAINVGWGSSVLVEGPTGKHMLLDSGNVGEGTAAVAPYLRAEGVASLDVIVLSHNHQDHSGGLSEIASAGFTAPLNYYNGSTGGSSTALTWESTTHATAITPGTVIDLGGGATATCIAANGRVIGQTTNYSGGDENDNSVALLIQYGGFKYIWEGDLGGAADAEDTCSGRTTSQVDVEVPMIRAILPGGSHPLIPSQSVDMIHVGHHGSMSSTHPVYVNLTAPTVALINTGHGQSSTWALPYVDTVDHVLLGGVNGCAGVPAPLVLQTEDGDQDYGSKRSTSGYAVGNIKVRTDGSHFWVSCNDDNGVVPYIAADNLATERANAGIPLGTEREFTVHGGGTTANTVTATITLPGSNATIPSGTTEGFAGSATDSSSTATMSYSWNFGDGGTGSGASASHLYTNTGSSSISYVASLTATDSTGASGAASRIITVSPAASKNTVTAAITTPSSNVTIASGASQAFAGAGTDSASGQTLTYTWAFGDGTTGSGASASHVFTNTGTSAVTDTATLTVTDGTGASAAATRAITVNPAPSSGATYNEVEPNNSRTAPDLVADAVTSIVGYFPSSSDNDDYFQVNLLAGHTLTVGMTGPTASSQDYDLYLYSSAGTQLASSTNSGTTEHLSYKNTNISAAKVLYIRVNRYASYSSKTPYTLTLSR